MKKTKNTSNKVSIEPKSRILHLNRAMLYAFRFMDKKDILTVLSALFTVQDGGTISSQTMTDLARVALALGLALADSDDLNSQLMEDMDKLLNP